MKVAVFNTKSYDREWLAKANAAGRHELHYLDMRLTPASARLTEGHEAVCVFVNDVVDAAVLKVLKANGVKAVVLRCAGFNNVDLQTAKELDIKVCRVPAYSPYAVAEHAVTLMMSLDRRIYQAHNRVREGNFELQGLMGREMHGRTLGVIGTGKIGQLVANIMNGFGMKIVCYDVYQNDFMKNLGASYVELDELLKESDVITLHCPLLPTTHHIINDDAINKMRQGVIIINTSRGGLMDAPALIRGLKKQKIGALGIDVYEQEADIFFQDLSSEVQQDDVFARLQTFPNVLITGHQAWFTQPALKTIGEVTVANFDALAEGKELTNECK